MKLKNIPDRIYLNLGLDGECGEVDFNELDEVTWSQDEISDGDIEYVRKKPIDWEARRFELVKEYLRGIMSDPNIELTIDELAETSVLVVDAIIAKMKGGQDV